MTRTLAENYRQPGAAEITASVDRLQQDVSVALGPEGHADRVPNLSLSLPICVALGRLLAFSEPNLPRL